jgi:formylglycine-generating enzyme required for sulfatase activity
MADQARVFVSHHHSPEEDIFTARLVADLEAAGADVWVDTSGITNDDFVRKISEGLTGRQWLVLVMTPDALRSPWVQREVNAALNELTAGRMRGVLPLVMQPCQEPAVPMLWRTLHRYDATGGYETTRSSLFAALGLTPVRSAPPVQPPLSSYTAPPDRFPPRLAELGYHVAFLNGAEVILPPVCDVPAGPFLMGSDPAKDKEAPDNEQPQHWMTLGAYQIAKYPVTVAEYACFVRATARPALTGEDARQWQVDWKTQLRQRLDHPVVMVSWNDALNYAKWLSERSTQHWRLLSEAEWEKAAKWDAPTGTARIYPWGDAFDKARCNTEERRKGTTPVGTYPTGQSPCGAQDMAGNVWEWSSSIFKPYPFDAADGRESVESTERRVLRGGSWYTSAWHARTTYRDDGHPVGVINDHGFRLARSVPNS